MSNDPANDDSMGGVPLSDPRLIFRRGVVRPIECLREGWEMLRGEYWLFFGISVVGYLIAEALTILLLGPMMCGIYYCFIQRERGLVVKFDDVFTGFQHFLQSFLATVMMALPFMVLVGPLYLGLFAYLFMNMPAQQAGAPPPDPSFAVNMLLMIAVLSVVAVVITFLTMLLCFFMYPLIADRKLKAWPALRTSAKAAFGNLGGLIGLIFLQWGMEFLGFLCCYVGMLFVLPVHFASVIVAYRKVFPEMDERYLRNKGMAREVMGDDDKAE